MSNLQNRIQLFRNSSASQVITGNNNNTSGPINITSISFPKNETSTFLVGTEEGSIFKANRFERAGSKSGIDEAFVINNGHDGLITNIQCHPHPEFSHLFLTSSIDWTIKLWKNVIV